MGYQIRKAKQEDFSRILQIYAMARRFMAENGNPDQWGDYHPPREMLQRDIDEGVLYVAEDGTGIHGVFAFLLGEDPTYVMINDGHWRSQRPYGTIHRIASDGSGGVFRACQAFCLNTISHLRIDTHRDNHIMQRALHRSGFSYRGVIYVSDGTERIAYDYLADDFPNL